MDNQKQIKRDAYLAGLIAKRDNGLVKVITGVRRCGKSYLLFTLYRQYLLENGVAEGQIVSYSYISKKNAYFCTTLWRFLKESLKAIEKKQIINNNK